MFVQIVQAGFSCKLQRNQVDILWWLAAAKLHLKT